MRIHKSSLEQPRVRHMLMHKLTLRFRYHTPANVDTTHNTFPLLKINYLWRKSNQKRHVFEYQGTTDSSLFICLHAIHLFIEMLLDMFQDVFINSIIFLCGYPGVTFFSASPVPIKRVGILLPSSLNATRHPLCPLSSVDQTRLLSPSLHLLVFQKLVSFVVTCLELLR